MADTLEPQVLYDSEDRKTPALGDVATLEAETGDVFSLTYWIAACMAATKLEDIYTVLNIGSRIVQDVTQDVQLDPTLFTPITGDGITSIADADLANESANFQTLYKNQQTIFKNQEKIYTQVNSLTAAIKVMIQYQLNYNYMKSWAASQADADAASATSTTTTTSTTT